MAQNTNIYGKNNKPSQLQNPRAMMTEESGVAMEEEDHGPEEKGARGGKSSQCLNENERKSASAVAGLSRKDRRKASKKEKRKQKRKEAAEKAREEEEARLNDPEEQRRIQLEEEREKERLERERREFEEKERLFLEALARRKAQEEEEEDERRRTEEARKLNDNEVRILRCAAMQSNRLRLLCMQTVDSLGYRNGFGFAKIYFF